MKTACSLLCLALLGLPASSHAQQPPATGTDAVSRSTVFDVVVTDKHGKAIPGLNQGDFQILDNGRPVPIRDFQIRAASEDAEEQPQMILLIDAVNAPFIAVSLARAQVENFLRRNGGQLPAQTSVAYLTDDGVEETGQPTRDGNALANVLHSREGELRSIRRSAGFYGAVERMQMSLNGLQLLLSHEAQRPGRKLLVWISPGWPMFDSPNVILSARDQRGIFADVVRLSHELSRAQMTIDMADPEGTWDAGRMHTFLWQSFLKPVSKPNDAAPGDLAIQVLASHSGGIVQWGSNDVAGEIARCAEDMQGWYRIRIGEQRGKEGPTWHNVAVKAGRKGSAVRTRSGYYAEP